MSVSQMYFRELVVGTDSYPREKTRGTTIHCTMPALPVVEERETAVEAPQARRSTGSSYPSVPPNMPVRFGFELVVSESVRKYQPDAGSFTLVDSTDSNEGGASGVTPPSDEESLLERLTELEKLVRKDEEAKMKDAYLPEDTFSLMALAPINSGAFFLGVGVFGLQLITLGLLTWDIILGSGDDFRGIPPFTSTQVRISQIVAIFIAILSQTDVVWSINVFLNGYANRNMSSGEEGEHEVVPASDAYANEPSEREGNNKTAVEEGIATADEPDCEEGAGPTRFVKTSFSSFEEIGSNVSKIVKEPNKGQWYIANACRLIEGLFCLVVVSTVVFLVLCAH